MRDKYDMVYEWNVAYSGWLKHRIEDKNLYVSTQNKQETGSIGNKRV